MANAFVAAFEILSFGAIIVLIVLGLGIIASMMGIFNFAQGEFVLLGAYITYLAYAKGLPIWTGMVAAPFVVGALGFVLEALIIRRFYAAPIVAMLGTYALGLIIRETVRGLIGGFYLTVPEPIGGSIDIGAMHISAWRFTIIIITALVMGGCYLLLARTSFGLRFLIQGFVAVMVGGVGSFIGPVAGAGVIGTLSAALPWVMAPVVADVLVFVLAIVFIKFRPQGLIAGKGV